MGRWSSRLGKYEKYIMNKLIHACSGLPRSGSTVLMNILQQNPQVFTTNSCALPDILQDHILIKSRYREFHQAMDATQADNAIYGLIQGAAQGWFSGLTDKPIAISKNRTWSNMLHLFPNCKVLATVRDLRDIVDSFVRYNSKIKALHTYSENQTFIPSMTDNELYKYFFTEGNAVSGSLYIELPRLMEQFKKNGSRIKFIRYEDFTLDPDQVLRGIYDFLELPFYQHDLYNIQQSYLYEHDNAYFRERTNHKISSTFKFYEPLSRMISQSLQDNIVNQNKWFYEGFYPQVLSS